MEKETLQQKNGNKEGGEDLSDMSTHELVEMLGQVYGVKNAMGQMEEADRDEEYRVFAEGPHSDQPFRRVPNPSYRLQKEIMKVCMKCKAVTATAKQAAAEHFGWDLDDVEAEYAPTDELGKFQMHKRILPLMVREDLPEGWDPEAMSSKEVERMWRHFFLST